MKSSFRIYAARLAALSAICVFGVRAFAQTAAPLPLVRPVNRIRMPIDDRARLPLTGNRHPQARAEFDAGSVAAETRMERMILVLAPDAAQQQALEDLLAAQQDAESPLYHQWLSPDQFGERFGVSAGDAGQVSAWLAAHGFEVESVSRSRREIVFSGTAAQVEAAFHAQVHSYLVEGEMHYANADDPEIPVALAPVIRGILSLHDFHSKPQHRGRKLADLASPLYTAGTAHYLAPADFATIYDVGALYTAGIDGTGQSIAVAGRTNFKLSDVQTFRSSFGLPDKQQPTIVLNGSDPGIISQDEEFEAALDVEWAGAVARNASIQFVLSASTGATDGVALSSQYIVNSNLAPIVTVSFGSCESSNGTSGNQFWNGLWQQAAAQGMTVFVASGDSGAAGCDGSSNSTAKAGAGVNALCSSPYSTCVGGTQFTDTAAPGTYWSAANVAVTGGSALSYIPETAWNESGAAGGKGLWASGGGESSVYPKPAWQVGTGVPTDGRRAVPDVSLTAAAHDGYLVRLENQLYCVSGTSASTPSFAGLMGLVVQKTGARQGSANAVLYGLAGKQATGGAAVFHDITTGNNTVPGVSGFSATPGYDAVTGLGSVDGSVMVNHWSDGSPTPTPAIQLSVTPAPVSLAVGANTSVTVKVTVSGGFNAAVGLSTGSMPAGLSASFSASNLVAPGSGSVTLKITASAQALPGTYKVVVAANGGGLTQSYSLGVTVTPNCTYSLNPASATVAASSGGGSFQVTAPTGCTWTAAPSATWLAVTGTNSGNGNGTVNYTVAANNAATSRSGSIAVAGQAFAVNQAAATVVYGLSPALASAPQSGGSGSVAVTVTPSGTSWSAVSNASWITITSGATGSGSRSVGYLVAANSTSAVRTGTITIGTVQFSITQAYGCSYSVALGSLTRTSGGYVGSVAVTAGTGCTWTASSSASWLTVTSGSSGSGNGTVAYLAANNTTRSSRSATLTVAGYAITITEGGTSSPAVRMSSTKR